MPVYARPNSALYWMSYTDENGKRWRLSTGTPDKQLAESIYQKAFAAAAPKKATKLASSMPKATAAKFDEFVATELSPTLDQADWSARTVALEKAVAQLHEQFNKLWIMFLGFEINQKKLVNLLAVAAQSLVGDGAAS